MIFHNNIMVRVRREMITANVACPRSPTLGVSSPKNKTAFFVFWKLVHADLVRVGFVTRNVHIPLSRFTLPCRARRHFENVHGSSSNSSDLQIGLRVRD